MRIIDPPKSSTPPACPAVRASGAGVAPGFESVRESGFLCPDPGCRAELPLVSLCLEFS